MSRSTLTAMACVWVVALGGCKHSVDSLRDAVITFSDRMEKVGGALDPLAIKEIFAAYRAEMNHSRDLEKALTAAKAELKKQENTERPVYRIRIVGQYNTEVRTKFKGAEKEIGVYEAPGDDSEDPQELEVTISDLVGLIEEGESAGLVFEYTTKARGRLRITVEGSTGVYKRREFNDVLDAHVSGTWIPQSLPVPW